jgi:2-keto-4-pentenoate hydratase/2-oxohepta-3-ene-1,7-dioic acid hydratase in catechol pathway
MSQIRKFQMTGLDGQRRWIEPVGDKVYLLADNDDPDRAQIERELASSEITNLKLLPPWQGRKVVGLAYNYASLVGEQQDGNYEEPLMFLKSPTSVCANGSIIKMPESAVAMWVEVELAIVIRDICKNVSREEAKNHILGVTVSSDITLQNVHGRDHHLARSKAHDNFCPIGFDLMTGLDTSDLAVETKIDGKIMQSGNTSDRICDDYDTVALISKFITLEPGDLILTGTPAGAMESLVSPGSVVEQTIGDMPTLIFTIE